MAAFFSYRNPRGTPSPDTCSCPRRVPCKWFKCGLPGPLEHAYKCEVFEATAGNYANEPAKLRHIKTLIAHVLGVTYSREAPHSFGACGKLWTIAALQYRLRDGPMAASFALLLMPRPIPVKLVQTVQKIAKTDKAYTPRSHRLFDVNPFTGLGVGRQGVEKKVSLSHVAAAIWGAHAAWLARTNLGRPLKWEAWEFNHVAPSPDCLLGEQVVAPLPARQAPVSPPRAPRALPRPASMMALSTCPPSSPVGPRQITPPSPYNLNQSRPLPAQPRHRPDVPRSVDDGGLLLDGTTQHWISQSWVTSPTASAHSGLLASPVLSSNSHLSPSFQSRPPSLVSYGAPSDESHNPPGSLTPPLLQARPRSFAGFGEWDKALPSRPSAPSPVSVSPEHPLCHKPQYGQPDTTVPRGIAMIRGNDSTYYIANETYDGDSAESRTDNPWIHSPDCGCRTCAAIAMTVRL